LFCIYFERNIIVLSLYIYTERINVITDGQCQVLIVAPIFLFQANRKKSSANDDEVKSDSMPDVETVRRIDAGVLTFKHVLISLFVLLLSAVTFLYFKDLNVDFSL
jgi:hypothetical protein